MLVAGVEVATGGEELADRVLATLVGFGGGADCLGRLQPVTEVGDCACDDPGEHCRRILPELFGEEFVAFFGGDGVDERDEVHAPPHGLAAVFDCRLVVAHQVQVVGGCEFEEVLVHEAGGDAVAAGECL